MYAYIENDGKVKHNSYPPYTNNIEYRRVNGLLSHFYSAETEEDMLNWFRAALTSARDRICFEEWLKLNAFLKKWVKETWSTKEKATSKKYDQNKLRWDLLPVEASEAIVKVLTYGAEKYGENTWQGIENAKERYFAALMRHLVAWRKGEAVDAESGLAHLDHVLCNASFLKCLEK